MQINDLVLSDGKVYIVKEIEPLRGLEYVFDGKYKAIGNMTDIGDFKSIPLALVKQYSNVNKTPIVEDKTPLDEFTRAELIDMLEEKGIEYGKKDNKEKLLKLLEV